jgi:hypothetical protein
MYYTKDGHPTFQPQTDEERFRTWVRMISDWKLIMTTKYVGTKVIHVQKAVGTGIAEPTEDELNQAITRPCSYRRAGNVPET